MEHRKTRTWLAASSQDLISRGSCTHTLPSTSTASLPGCHAMKAWSSSLSCATRWQQTQYCGVVGCHIGHRGTLAATRASRPGHLGKLSSPALGHFSRSSPHAQ